MKEIDIANETFAEFINHNSYYVDKTSFIKTIFKRGTSKVMLITRPRRFGKTLAISTFHEFLRINPNNPDNPADISYQEQLFKDTMIYGDQEFCREHMGKYPVISVSFKTVFGKDFESAYDELGGTVFDLASKYVYLLENKNGKLSESQLSYLKKLSDYEFACDFKNKKYVIGSLEKLTELLSVYHGVNPILLIDEYDVPIAKAAARGYYDDIIDIMSVLLSKALKTNPYLGKAVLTGCLRAAKESIFTGLINLDVCSILDMGTHELSKGIGFTKEDTQHVLDYYGLDKFIDLVTNHYDGYRFGREHMYCPWDVMNFCKKNYQNVGRNEKDIAGGNYCLHTSGNAVIEEYMGYIEPENINKMQSLLDGNTITTAVRTSLCYGDLKNHDIEDFWTLLLYTGYLTFDPDSVRYDESVVGDFVCDVFIPNKEIRLCFQNRIMSFYKKNPRMQNCMADFVKGLFSGDAQRVEDNLTSLLQKYVSLRDFASNAPKENYYHGFMNGLLVNSSQIIQEQSSNKESGDGYVDLIISSKTEPKFVLLELKKTDSPTDDRKKIAQSAIKQIREKMYAEPYISNTTIEEIYAFGICFFNKRCSVVYEKLK